MRTAKGGDDDETMGSGIGDRMQGGSVGREGFNGTSRHVEERTATWDGMLRIPDESQGQNADPETHASGIPSINVPDVGLVERDAERKEKEGKTRNTLTMRRRKRTGKKASTSAKFMEERAADSPYWQTRTLLKTLVCQERTWGERTKCPRV